MKDPFTQLIIFLFLISKVMFGMLYDFNQGVVFAGFNFYVSDLVVCFVLFGMSIFFFKKHIVSDELIMPKAHLSMLLLFLIICTYIIVGAILYGKGSISDGRPFLNVILVGYALLGCLLWQDMFGYLSQATLLAAGMVGILSVAHYTGIVDLFSANVTMYEALVGARVTQAHHAILMLIGSLLLFLPNSLLKLPRQMVRFRIFIITFFLCLIVINQHRSVIISALIAFEYIVLCSASVKQKFLVITLTLMALIPMIFGFSLDSLTFIGTSLLNPLDDPNANWRLYAWAVYLEDIAASPLFGHDFGVNFVWSYFGGEEMTTQAHNGYIQIAHRMGLLGLLVFIQEFRTIQSFQWTSFRKQNARIKRTLEAVLLSSLVFLIMYGVDYTAFLILALTFTSTSGYRHRFVSHFSSRVNARESQMKDISICCISGGMK